MSDIWSNAIKQICPEIDELTAIMNDESTIKPIIEFKRSRCMVSLVELFPGDHVDPYDTTPTRKFHERVEWMADELTSWEKCTRLGWNDWRFEQKRDAEKFITLYNLIWVR